ncbi:MAG: zf-HC2 domain-containing protein [Elusimicrobiota bacterium]
MDFKELCDLISDYIDKELGEDICSEIEEHLNMHSECMTLFNTYCETIYLCRKMEELEVPREVHVKLYRRLRLQIITSDDPEEN